MIKSISKETVIPLGLITLLIAPLMTIGYAWGQNEEKILGLEAKFASIIEQLEDQQTQIIKIEKTLARIETMLENRERNFNNKN